MKKEAEMDPTLKELVRRGDELKAKSMLLADGYGAFEEWFDECIMFLEILQHSFRQEVSCPRDIEKGIAWLEGTFREL